MLEIFVSILSFIGMQLNHDLRKAPVNSPLLADEPRNIIVTTIDDINQFTNLITHSYWLWNAIRPYSYEVKAIRSFHNFTIRISSPYFRQIEGYQLNLDLTAGSDISDKQARLLYNLEISDVLLPTMYNFQAKDAHLPAIWRFGSTPNSDLQTLMAIVWYRRNEETPHLLELEVKTGLDFFEDSKLFLAAYIFQNKLRDIRVLTNGPYHLSVSYCAQKVTN
jgi:hypothetical protein